MIDSGDSKVPPKMCSVVEAFGRTGDERKESNDSDSANSQTLTQTSEREVLPESDSVFQAWQTVAGKKQGLLWAFKKGGQFGTDELTVTVADIHEKRVKILVQFSNSSITCSGPASFELQLVSLTILVEEVGNKKTKLRILSRQRVVIRRE
jgi:hypothetical protein